MNMLGGNNGDYGSVIRKASNMHVGGLPDLSA